MGGAGVVQNHTLHRASSAGSEEPWPTRPNVNKTGMNQNSRQWLLFISLVATGSPAIADAMRKQDQPLAIRIVFWKNRVLEHHALACASDWYGDVNDLRLRFPERALLIGW